MICSCSASGFHGKIIFVEVITVKTPLGQEEIPYSEIELSTS
jgi:hypothetical protein